MAKGHDGLPKSQAFRLRKIDIMTSLRAIDQDNASRVRILQMETSFRQRIDANAAALPTSQAKFEKFFTSPFVLLMHARRNTYSRISEIESDILPAKLFSSMETSAGRIMEEVTLPAYGWERVPSEMHTPNSAIDGRKIGSNNKVMIATLKSGPRCLNDEMSENFADAVIGNAHAWAKDAGVSGIDFTYGVLYGTKKQSNKKDWHILRNIWEKLDKDGFTITPEKRWDCHFERDGISVNATVRVGKEWWDYLGGKNCLLEVTVALIRACITVGVADKNNYAYNIRDLGDIVSTDCIPEDYNVSLLQQSQYPWLFFMMRHFCDSLE